MGYFGCDFLRVFLIYSRNHDTTQNSFCEIFRNSVNSRDNSGLALGSPNKMSEPLKLSWLSFNKIRYVFGIIRVAVSQEYFKYIKRIIFLRREWHHRKFTLWSFCKFGSGKDNSAIALGTSNEMDKQTKLSWLSFYKIRYVIGIIRVAIFREYF